MLTFILIKKKIDKKILRNYESTIKTTGVKAEETSMKGTCAGTTTSMKGTCSKKTCAGTTTSMKGTCSKKTCAGTTTSMKGTCTELLPIQEVAVEKFAKVTPEEEKLDEIFDKKMTSPIELIKYLLVRKEKVTFYHIYFSKCDAIKETKMINDVFPGKFDVSLECNCTVVWSANHLPYCNVAINNWGSCNCKCPFEGCLDICDTVTILLKPKKRFPNFGFGVTQRVEY